MDRVVNDREVVIVRRKRGQRVAIIAADELRVFSRPRTFCVRPKMRSGCLRHYEASLRRKGKPEAVDKIRQEMRLARPR